jgi:methionyl-tRNA formyltransferase
LLDDALTVACGEGALRLAKVQRAGKSAMNAAELLKGYALPRGTHLV